MNKEEAIKMAKAKLECLERSTSGLWENCNNDCENCDLNYDQGNMGEQKEWLKMAIKTLEQEPCEDIREYFKDIWDCDINHPRYEDTVADIVEKSFMSGYVRGAESTAKEIGFELEQDQYHDLCKSCDTKGCIFQSGIKRERCDFYTSRKGRGK